MKKQYDSEQIKYMNERIIIVDKNDKLIRSGTKKECHLVSTGLLLHRAFSVFLFNSNNELLLQQRSKYKITFPLYFTNSCCSHPLYTKEEMNETNNIGIKKAAIRKLKHELGINDLSISDFKYIDKFKYKAIDKLNGNIWGEYEIDYILIVKIKEKFIKLNINKNEVKKVCYLSKKNFNNFKNNNIISPWLIYIYNSGLLNEWWM